MRNYSVRTSAARTVLAVLATALIGCGGGGSGDSATAVSPGSSTAQSGTASGAGSADGSALNAVPGNTGDSPSVFMAFLKAMMTPNDESSDSWTIPVLKDASGDDTAEPASTGS
jgi:hypothetical protein